MSDAPRSDAELIAAANRGDADAFAALYQRYRDWAVALALRWARGDRELALDAAQEAFMWLLGKFPGFELRAQMKTVLYPVVRNVVLTAHRRRGAEPLPGGLASPVHDDQELGDLHEAMAALPPLQREVLMLRFGDDLPLADIAAALDVPLGTVKSRLHTALATLRADERLKNLDFD